ncbi:MAG: WG repeat-containing protein, partial [Bacteroidales bacterium]|nr:WG repeat-containing protein [Bacteroidales bacterium]
DKYGFIDKTGKEIIACQYDDTEDIENGLVKVNSMGMWGYVNIKGEEIVPCMYVAVGKPDCELRTPVKLSLKWGYIDSLGMDIAPAKYDTIGNFVNNLAIAKSLGKWGYIDNSGETKIGFKYNEVHDFHNGIAKVKYGNRYGYIDENGTEVIPMEYQNIYSFNDEIIEVNIVNSYNGDDAVTVDIFDILKFNDGYYIFKKDGKWGAMDSTLKVVVDNKYNSIKEVKKDLYK